MAPADISTELARRSIALLLLSETSLRQEDNEIVTVLSEILSLVIRKTLRVASTHATHSNRQNISIFDILKTLPTLRMSVNNLLNFALTRGKPLLVKSTTNKGPSVIPPGRSLIRALGDEEDEDETPMDRGPRPAYLTDIYPPFPRAYTFRRTETRGVREGDKVLIAKAKAEQQRQVESNLFRLLSKTNSIREVINYEDQEDQM